MSAQPYSPTRHGRRRRSSRHPSEPDSASDADTLAEKRAASERARSAGADDDDHRPRPRQSGGGGGSDRFAVVPRQKQPGHGDEDPTRAVQRVARRRRSDDSIASSASGRTHVYDSYGRRQDDRRRSRGRHSGRGYDDYVDGQDGREQRKKRSKLDPRVFLAAFFCFATAAFCWNEISDD